jgi:hypothetical protein
MKKRKMSFTFNLLHKVFVYKSAIAISKDNDAINYVTIQHKKSPSHQA